MNNFKPMLSATVDDVTQLRFPLLASPKLDGIRAMVIDSVLVSRNLKPIPNKRLQAIFGKTVFNGLDGELIVGAANAADCFRATSSGVMSVEGDPDAFLHVFDHFLEPSAPFLARYARAERIALDYGRTVPVQHHLVSSTLQLEKVEEKWLEQGYEGVMLRHPESPYKFGRGTFTEHDLMKLKRFADAEATVIAVEEQMENLNEATKDNLGHTKRSTHKANKRGKNTLGAVIVKGLNGPYKGAQFSIGSGFDDATRAELWSGSQWQCMRNVVGRIVKYKYFPSGSKDAPRFPVFLGWRDELDL